MFIPRRSRPQRGKEAAQLRPTMEVLPESALRDLGGITDHKSPMPGELFCPISVDGVMPIGEYREYMNDAIGIVGSQTTVVVRVPNIAAARKLESAAAFRRFQVAPHGENRDCWGQIWYTVWSADSTTLEWLSRRPWILETREVFRQLAGTGSSSCAPLPPGKKKGKGKKKRGHSPGGQRIPDCRLPPRRQGECLIY